MAQPLFLKVCSREHLARVFTLRQKCPSACKYARGRARSLEIKYVNAHAEFPEFFTLGACVPTGLTPKMLVHQQWSPGSSAPLLKIFRNVWSASDLLVANPPVSSKTQPAHPRLRPVRRDFHGTTAQAVHGRCLQTFQQTREECPELVPKLWLNHYC